jgi:hypothetical protein
MTYDGTNGITFPDSSLQKTAGYSPFRNRIINGDMRIDQRNSGASVTPTDAQYTVDRWIWQQVTAGKCTVQQSSTAPTGFTKSLLITSTSAYTPLAGDVMTIGQRIEGFNVADLAWGTASAQTVTVSFWVRSSLTGTFGGTLRNNGANRSYPFTFTINSANTFEYKTITVAGDTSGTWTTDNTSGLQLSFAVGCGATYKGTAGAWASATYYSATGATDLVGTNGATFYITGVQLEKGSVATPFEYRPYGQELALCQRYYYRMTNSSVFRVACGTFYSGTLFLGTLNYPVTMRTSPTGSVSAAGDFAAEGNGGSYYASAMSVTNQSPQSCRLDMTISGGTQGYGGNIFGVANKWLDFSAEL